ncbi:denticleless protein homolog A-like [Physella acuta]|uniref:denticleless protein homolog A-like n=1 Tax=Physella acuta TaxID=109671 RepID=UPI0027DCD516|nr:denticleless protein homolog A-like [Physella acuta]
MLQRHLHFRSFSGTSSVTSLAPSLDLSFILKKFKNYSTDEYSTMDHDGMSVPPLACAFAKMPQHQHIVGVVDEDGYLGLYDTRKTGQASIINNWQVHANAVFDIEWLQEENKILTGAGDQKICLHDLATLEKLEVFSGHTSSVKSISVHPGNDAVFVSGSRDGHIMMWDKRISHKDGGIPPINTILNAHTLKHNTNPTKARKKAMSQVRDAHQSVTAVLFQNENYVISSGAVDGCLKIWDIRKNYRNKIPGAVPVHVFNYPGTNSRKHGYSSLVQDSRGLRLFASCTDDVIYQYDLASYNPVPVNTWKGHKNTTFYVKAALSPDDQYLLSGSSDEHAYIWQINKPNVLPIILKGHTAEVTSVTWCPNDITKLVTLSDDTKTKFWRVYCRELKEFNHPQILGKAERTAKERATSTASDIPSLPSVKPAVESTSVLPAASNLKAEKKPVKSNPDGPVKSISHWLNIKRKANGDPNPLACKMLRQELEPSTSEQSSLSTDGHVKQSMAQAPSPAGKKRPFEESEESSAPDSPVCVLDPCVNCSPDKGNCNKHLFSKAKKAKYTDSQTVSASPEDKKTTDQACCVDNHSKHSPSKKTNCHRNTSENIPHLSPQKRKLPLDMNVSPKRPCLTSLSGNKLDSCRVSLFTDKLPLDSQSASRFSQFETDFKVDSESECEHSSSSCTIKDTCGDQTLCMSEFPHCSGSLRTPSKEELFTSRVSDEADFNSPTRNLPNLVFDEHNQTVTPPRQAVGHSPKVDWLTQIRLEKIKKSTEKSPKQTTPVRSRKVKGLKKISTFFK